MSEVKRYKDYITELGFELTLYNTNGYRGYSSRRINDGYFNLIVRPDNTMRILFLDSQWNMEYDSKVKFDGILVDQEQIKYLIDWLGIKEYLINE